HQSGHSQVEAIESTTAIRLNLDELLRANNQISRFPAHHVSCQRGHCETVGNRRSRPSQADRGGSCSPKRSKPSVGAPTNWPLAVTRRTSHGLIDRATQGNPQKARLKMVRLSTWSANPALFSVKTVLISLPALTSGGARVVYQFCHHYRPL